MRPGSRDESGQAAIEFAIFGTVLFMLTVGFIDIARGFYQYNAVSNAARYGARWGSVIGGTCIHPAQAPVNDWCNQLGTNSSRFWVQTGNRPKQSGGAACPSTYSAASYYNVSDFTGTSSTTIMGAIANRFDTNAGSSNFINGGLSPGFDLTKLAVCIELPASSWIPATSTYDPSSGSTLSVHVYYPFAPTGHLLTTAATINLTASSEFTLE